MTQIYYDPTGGFLYGIDANGNPEIVKTDVCVMMPENVFVDNIGKIHVKDLQGLDTCISDGQGNDAIIMGPIGPLGPAGPQGTSVTITSLDSSDPSKTLITFSDGQSISVYNGNDGKDGQNGLPGAPGTKFLVPDSTVTDELLGKGDPDLLPFNIAQIQDGDYTISTDTQTIWVWSNAIINFQPLFSLKGEQGIQGIAGPAGPQGAKGDQGDSYFTQPVADKLTAIAGEYDSVKKLSDNCATKILELENRIAVLEGYMAQLDSIDLSGLAIAYPKDVTPEEA